MHGRSTLAPVGRCFASLNMTWVEWVFVGILGTMGSFFLFTHHTHFTPRINLTAKEAQQM